MLWQYHQESSPHKSWTYQIHQCEAFCICALVLSRFSGTAFTGSQHDIWLEQSSDHIQNKKDLPTLERSTTVSFFSARKVGSLEILFPAIWGSHAIHEAWQESDGPSEGTCNHQRIYSTMYQTLHKSFPPIFSAYAPVHCRRSMRRSFKMTTGSKDSRR